jgi:hypothetical protein
MLISEDRKKRVIDLSYNQGKTTREIAKIERMSIRDIHSILKEEEARRQNYQHQQKQEEISSKAYKLFSEGKKPLEIAIQLSLREPEATKLFIEYCKLKRLHKFYLAYKELGDNGIRYFVMLCQLAKKEGIGIKQVINAVDIAANKLPYMENIYRQLKDEVDNLQRIRQYLSNDIQALKNKFQY